MVATNRLTGHSRGFFSVYTLPPNQAVSAESQKRINRKREQVPEYRDTHRDNSPENKEPPAFGISGRNRTSPVPGRVRSFLPGMPVQPRQSRTIRYSSPLPPRPFLDIVQYREDNWLRCWFNGLDEDCDREEITMARTVDDWNAVMGAVFAELFRITRPGGVCCIRGRGSPQEDDPA